MAYRVEFQVSSIPSTIACILGKEQRTKWIATNSMLTRESSGNAFALFLKSQRKWDNPPLQDDHRDQFCQLCQDNGYDAAKYVAHKRSHGKRHD